MSNLITSYLVDPVIRQARRFSRSGASPGSGSEHSTRPASRRRRASSSASSSHDGAQLLQRRVQSIHEQSVYASQDVMTDTTATYYSDQADQTMASSPPTAPSPDPVREEALRTLDQVSNNPNHEVPAALRPAAVSSRSNVSLAGEGSSAGQSTPAYDSEDAARPAASGATGSSALPADDGMSVLRQRIVAIREMTLPETTKALLMHSLMTENYTARMLQPGSPTSPPIQDRPFTPSSTNSGSRYLHDAWTPRSSVSLPDPENPYNLTPDDLKPTFVPRTVPAVQGILEAEVPSVVENETDEPRLGCQHYKRNVKLQCADCLRWYTCRFCHDEKEDHTLNRRKTKNMLCMRCSLPQPASAQCQQCNGSAAYYYCDICKLWDDDNEKSIYHCDDCGICRVGQGLGKDFYHCKTCGVCMSIAIADSHRCIERSTDCNCPICGEYMFTSPHTVVFMKCGHSIHHKCFYEHMKTSYRCPICSRSVVNMEIQFRNLDRAIEEQPMPPQFQDTKAVVSCNDCSAKTIVQYHWLGLKCGVCDSYNTAQIQILSGEEVPPATEQSNNALAPPPQPPPNGGSTPSTQPPSRGRAARGAGGPSAPLAIPEPPGHRRQGSSASATDAVRFSPYPIPQRTGRSASPLRTYTDLSGVALENERDADRESQASEEDSVDFWGADGPSDRFMFNFDAYADDSEDEESEDDTSDSPDHEDDEDDDEDEIDHMALIGHR